MILSIHILSTNLIKMQNSMCRVKKFNLLINEKHGVILQLYQIS